MDKIKFTVEMEVTIPQALTLQAMFERWNTLGRIGSSRTVSFYVDGDGNFQPNCKITTDKEIPKLTDELRKLTEVHENMFDYDNIAWKLSK